MTDKLSERLGALFISLKEEGFFKDPDRVRASLEIQRDLVALQERVERQAEHITHTDGSIENRNEKVRKWKRLHNKLGKKYAVLKQRVKGIDEALQEIADLVDPNDPHDLGGPHISIPWILDRFAAIEEEKDDRISETAN